MTHKLTTEAKQILENELPFAWVVGEDISVIETETAIVVTPVSHHAEEHIGCGEYLEFKKRNARKCLDCETSLTGRHGARKRCDTCNSDRHRGQQRAYFREYYKNPTNKKRIIDRQREKYTKKSSTSEKMKHALLTLRAHFEGELVLVDTDPVDFINDILEETKQ